jgi:phosphoserine phosphatase
MKRLALSFLVSLVSLSGLAKAELIEIQEMDQTVPFLEDDTLLIFDLDNTIIEATTSLGGDQWFSRLVKLGVDAGLPEQAAKDAAVARWLKVQPFVQVRAVEAGTPALIAELQACGYRIMGLTARPEAARADTLRQLASVGVRFADDVGLKDGILFVNNGDKGEALLKLAQEQGRTLTSVEMVDDKLGNVEAVGKALDRWNARHPDAYVNHLEARYGAADPRVAAYDHSIAETQERLLQAIVPDGQALLIRDGLR